LEVYLVDFERATTKKVVNFFEEKSALPDKVMVTPIYGLVFKRSRVSKLYICVFLSYTSIL